MLRMSSGSAAGARQLASRAAGAYPLKRARRRHLRSRTPHRAATRRITRIAKNAPPHPRRADARPPPVASSRTPRFRIRRKATATGRPLLSMQLSGAPGSDGWTGALLLPRAKQASEPILTRRPLRTRVARSAQPTPDARIPRTEAGVSALATKAPAGRPKRSSVSPDMRRGSRQAAAVPLACRR